MTVRYSPKYSVIIPAKNEAAALAKLLPTLKEELPEAEIIVVDDGSSDSTAEVCGSIAGVHRIHHPYSKGNGAAIKSGAREAQGEILLFMDGDGQHRPADLRRLIDRIEAGYDMAVGARSSASQASKGRLVANGLYNRLATMFVGHTVADLTSGMRAAVAVKFREFLYMLPNGFSYPTTITMAFFRAGYSVAYIPIVADRREGKSHINLLKDGTRFLLIIFKIGTLYSPLKLFLPISLSFFATGIGYTIFTLIALGRFTNMAAVILSVSVLIFLIGLVSEQITTLLYSGSNQQHESADQ